MPRPRKLNDLTEETRKTYSEYFRYSTLVLQMAVIIAGAAIGGYYLDKWTSIHFPVFTVVLALAGVALALWLFIKEVLKKKS